jgi:hypothetical protein
MLHEIPGAFRPDHGRSASSSSGGDVEIDDPVFVVNLAVRAGLLLPWMVVLEISHAALLSPLRKPS